MCDFKGTEGVTDSCASRWPWRFLPSSTFARTSLRVTSWSLNDVTAPPLRGGGMRLLVASAGSTDGLLRWIDRKAFLHFNKAAAEAALGSCHPHFPLTLSDKDEQSSQTGFLWCLGWVCPHSHQQSSCSECQPSFSFPRETLEDTLPHFRLLGISVGAEAEEGEEMG